MQMVHMEIQSTDTSYPELLIEASFDNSNPKSTKKVDKIYVCKIKKKSFVLLYHTEIFQGLED